MNKLQGKILQNTCSKGICLVEVKVNAVLFDVFVLDQTEKEEIFTKDQKVTLLFNETDLILSKDKSANNSVENEFQARVEYINKGTILSEVFLNFEGNKISAIVSTEKIKELSLTEGSALFGLVKASNILISS